ncbi:Mce protein [Mycobacterium sp.]|uniref:Mce protein n=1 Tax=Mycobacterium sp. TaxID=1785 RepID=UPI003F9D94BB
MEGDAGANRRLNPPPMSMIRRLRNRRPKILEESDSATEQTDTAVTAEDSEESGAATEQTSPPEVTAEDSEESEVGTEQSTKVAGEAPEESEATDALADAVETDVERRPSRLGRGWVAGIAAALVLFAGGIGAGGYLALRAHQESQAIARNNSAALEAAKVCVAATQAPDTGAMAASEQKIVDCGTDVYRTQALLYTSLLVQAYQAANVHVQVSDERAAVERNNSDGSVDVLVALRVKVSNDQAQNQETGYRLRVKMSPVDGQYKIARLDQVTK